MAFYCFIGKSPRPKARVAGARPPDVPLPDFEAALPGGFGMPDELMSQGFEDRTFGFTLMARAEISRQQSWTWVGSYRPLWDRIGRPGAYLAAGILFRGDARTGASILAERDQAVAIAEERFVGPHLQLCDLASVSLDDLAGPSLDPAPERSLTGTGLRSDGKALLYCPCDQADWEGLIDAAQTDPEFSAYRLLVFAPTPSFAEVLDRNPHIDRRLFVAGALEKRAEPAGPVAEPAAPASPPFPPTPRLDPPGPAAVDEALDIVAPPAASAESPPPYWLDPSEIAMRNLERSLERRLDQQDDLLREEMRSLRERLDRDRVHQRRDVAISVVLFACIVAATQWLPPRVVAPAPEVNGTADEIGGNGSPDVAVAEDGAGNNATNTAETIVGQPGNGTAENPATTPPGNQSNQGGR